MNDTTKMIIAMRHRKKRLSTKHFFVRRTGFEISFHKITADSALFNLGIMPQCDCRRCST
ncbi:hypothetical protein LF95_14335 [Thalassospira sp. TSL5-1]|nr:hypothetical protein LF95_14335 [Thalassospira sp. TSL5-1]